MAHHRNPNSSEIKVSGVYLIVEEWVLVCIAGIIMPRATFSTVSPTTPYLVTSDGGYLTEKKRVELMNRG